jgi:flagellar M-ring protein FliF
MLGEILGHGRSVARVTATIDFSKLEKEEESYDPAGTVMRSERSVEENAGSSTEGGVPGVLSNLTNQTGVISGGGDSNSKRKESLKNYEISRAVSKIVKNPGKIDKLSVAVLVDGQYVDIETGAVTEEGKPIKEKKYLPLTPDMIRKVDNLVKQTVGYDASRGDIVTVENIRFVEPDETLLTALEKNELEQKLWSMTEWLPALLLFLATLMIVIRPMVKFLVTPSDAEVDLSRLLPAGLDELEAELEAERAKLSSIPEKVKPAIDIEELETLLADNSRMVKDNPQQAALLIRYWLNDGRI